MDIEKTIIKLMGKNVKLELFDTNHSINTSSNGILQSI